jgi:hypothetical protein
MSHRIRNMTFAIAIALASFATTRPAHATWPCVHAYRTRTTVRTTSYNAIQGPVVRVARPLVAVGANVAVATAYPVVPANSVAVNVGRQPIDRQIEVSNSSVRVDLPRVRVFVGPVGGN